MIGRWVRWGGLLLTLGLPVGGAQDGQDSPESLPRLTQAAARPFSVGEKLTYSANVNFLHVGTATMEVVGVDTIRGRPAYHVSFNVRGRMLFFVVDDHYDSWFDVHTLSSLRYIQSIHEGSYRKKRHFEFFPERRTLIDSTDTEDHEEQPSVSDPLDEASFTYFVRTLDLEVGRSYEFNRYFRPDANPVKIDVLRREAVEVQAGNFDATVIRPTIKTTGLFSQGGHAEIWLADDSSHVVLKMTSGLPFGTLILELKQIGKAG